MFKRFTFKCSVTHFFLTLLFFLVLCGFFLSVCLFYFVSSFIFFDTTFLHRAGGILPLSEWVGLRPIGSHPVRDQLVHALAPSPSAAAL